MTEEHSGDETVEERSHIPVNRRKVLKAIGAAGGVAVAGRFASPAQASGSATESASTTRIEREKITDLARQLVRQDDVANVITSGMREVIESGRAVELQANDPSSTVFSRGSRSEVKANGVNNLAGDDVLVMGGRHILKNENMMTSVAFVSGNGQVLAYRGYELVEDGIKDKALLYNVVEDKLSVETTSYNGAEPRPVPEVKPSDVTKPLEDVCPPDPCGGCHPSDRPGRGGDYGEYAQAVCNTSLSLDCLIYSGACPACVASCPVAGPACIACAIAMCASALARCCDGLETECLNCGCGVCC